MTDWAHVDAVHRAARGDPRKLDALLAARAAERERRAAEPHRQAMAVVEGMRGAAVRRAGTR